MVPPGGRNRADLSDALRRQPYRFDFFQAVRLLERTADEEAEAGEEAPRRAVGEDHAPHREVVRFRAVAAHSFPAGSIRELLPGARKNRDEDEFGPPELVTAFMGLFGPNGVLPRHYTSLVIERVREKDYALRDFLDLFNHRVLSLFYRAWEKYRFPFAYERFARTKKTGRDDQFTECLYSLLGFGTGGLRRRMEFDDEALLYFGGFFAHQPRSAAALSALLSDYFEMPVDIEQFHGQWLYLDESDQSSLPCARWPQGLNTSLSAGVVIGQRVWDVQSMFRVRLGPLSYPGFQQFTPSGDALLPLCQLVRTYVGSQFDFDVQPVLRGDEVPWCRLGGDDDPSRLGWNTWIRSSDLDHDVSDATFSLEGSPWTR